MAVPEQTNISEDIEKILENDEDMVVFNHVNYSAEMDEDQWEALADALSQNETVTELLLDDAGVINLYAVQVAKALETNSCLKILDLKNNKIGPEGLFAIADMLTKNDCLEIIKLDFQTVPSGADAESRLAQVFDVNTSLLELRLKCRDISFRKNIMEGEIRNKQIAKKIASGEDWAELDPAQRNEIAAARAASRAAEKKAEEEKAAPVLEKVEETGGPYTFKELTCAIALRPKDVPKGKREQYLNDDEFMDKFGCDKVEFEGWPKWKKKNTKKALGLH